jgi:branched-chain amino acid transport system substrate-binding protein
MKKIIFTMAFIFGLTSFIFAGSIKVGGLFALTGPAAHIGIAQKNACKLIFEEANQNGGINGKKIELIEVDTQMNPTKALLGAKKLVEQNKVCAIIGPTTTGSGMAVKPYINKMHVPTFMHAGSDIIIDKPPIKYVFKSPYRSSVALGKIFIYMKNHGLKTYAFLYSADGFGRDGFRVAKKLSQKYGVKMVASESFGRKDVDMTAQLVKVKDKNPDAIIAWTIGPAGGIVAKNKKRLGMKQPLFQCHGQCDPIFLKVAGDAAEGVMMPATKIYVADQLPDSDPQKKKILHFVKIFKEKYGYYPGTMVAYGVDAAYLVLEALKHVGCNKEKIRDYLENKTYGYVGISGIYKITPKDHNGLSINDVVLVKVVNGKWKLVK